MRNYKDRITVNEDGAFIPREMFGQKEEILDELKQAGVFSPLSDQQKEKPKKPVRVEMIDVSREMQWLKEHRQEYTGQWVALDGDRLVAYGKDAREVYQAAKEAGVEVPLVEYIDKMDELPFGGW